MADVRDEVSAYVVDAPRVRVVLDEDQDVLLTEGGYAGRQAHVGAATSRDLDVDVPDLTVARDQTYGSGESGMGQPPVPDDAEGGCLRAGPHHTVVSVKNHGRGSQDGQHGLGIAECWRGQP